MLRSSQLLLTTLLVVILCHSNHANPVHRADGSLHLNILHTNDMHARFEETSKLSSACSSSDSAAGNCYGGFARIATLVRQARNSSTPVLFLNAGDTYQGSVWYNVHKWKIVARFLNILNPDAISLGNHEFDDGVDGLVPFINNATFPVLTANLNLTGEPTLEASKLLNSTILTVDGIQIGIIGYLTPETKTISSSGNVVFLDEVERVAEEAARLKAEGVNILIALGHSGFETDKKIAAEVEDIDLVIGGHTNTFLYTGNQPDSEVPEGLYPTEITQESGRKVYVVQAYAYTKYLGNLSLTFDSEGELTYIEGNPILVDGTVEEASDVLSELEEWREAINNLTQTIVGSTKVLLDGDSKSCRRSECNLGNLITDAMVDYVSRQYAGSDGWTDGPIAIQHGGGIRTSITRDNEDQITMADVLGVLPFGNAILAVPMTGAEILSMLEWSVHSLDLTTTSSLNGAFLQYSGLRVTYDLSQAVNSRVVSAQVRCGDCRVPTFSALNETAEYTVLMSDFLLGGGDGYSMLTNLSSTVIGMTVSDVLADYLEKRSPVYPGVEWRITFENSVSETSGASHVSLSIAMILLPLISLLSYVSH